MAMNTTKYFSFLLRLWVVRDEDALNWRASLENPQTQEIIGFGSIQQLVQYLEHITDLNGGDELL